jgi:hypothetical protein
MAAGMHGWEGMPKDQKEPQSYGSGPDWVTGKTGQEVNDQDGGDSSAAAPPPAKAGGTPALHDDEPVAHPSITAEGDHGPTTGVTSAPGGTKTDGYFKKRDYQ